MSVREGGGGKASGRKAGTPRFLFCFKPSPARHSPARHPSYGGLHSAVGREKDPFLCRLIFSPTLRSRFRGKTMLTYGPYDCTE